MKHLPALLAATVLIAAPAMAAPSTYIWTGAGQNVPGSSKCPTYTMTVSIVVEGNKVVAKFQQEGRTERHFEATLDGQGHFQTKAEVGGGGSIAVSGVIGAQPTVLLDGYCKFGGPLKKQ